VVAGVGHWHAPMYIKALQDLGQSIAAISDPSAEALERVGGELDCPRYESVQELLDREQPDFVFAHAPHCDMTELARTLVAAQVPFSIEKPAGINWRELEPVATLAKTEGLFASVALVARAYPLVRRLRALEEEGRLGRLTHYYYRLFAGAPDRYRDWHVPWMLDPKQAGGGCTFNFGPHVIDLFRYLTNQKVVEVFCRTSNLTHGEPVEDLSCLLMRGEAGALGVAEVSYTHPDGYERYFSLTSDTLHCSGDLEQGTVIFRSGERLAVEPEPGDWTSWYVERTLARWQAGEPPLATLGHMTQALRVINAAMESARTGAVVALPVMDRRGLSS